MTIDYLLYEFKPSKPIGFISAFKKIKNKVGQNFDDSYL